LEGANEIDRRFVYTEVAMTKTFVVPLDGSTFAERALPVAAGMAEHMDGRLLAATTDWEAGSRDAERYLRDLAGAYPGLETLLVRLDDPADAIEFAAHDGVDRTVCMTSHGRGGMRWAVLGSVAEDVIRRMQEPVVVVGKHCAYAPAPGKDLVVCFDEGPPSGALIEAACTWAQHLDLRVELVFVAHPLDIETAEHPESVFNGALHQIEAHGLVGDATLLSSSYVAGTIADHATARNAAMIAVATRGRTGVARIGLGSVAMGLVGAAPCPVLVTRGQP
jgi:nucleotide-binding universal stress UspA family protein